MRIVRELNPDIIFNQPILTLGTYDGVHLGHQQIIGSLVKKAKAEGKESVLFTFDPHPRKVLYPDSYSVKLIDTLEEKLEKLEVLGLDTVILYPFTREFSRLTAMEFVRNVLVNQIGVSEMHIGYDHHFGKNREGSFQELQELGEVYGFSVHQISAFSIDDTTVSSTKIRNAILEGKIHFANKLLGSVFHLSGRVVQGKQLGRTIGFPTANVQIDNPEKILPKNGVYIVQVQLKGAIFNGVMNIGTRPTVSNDEAVSVEVFLLDFNEDIYGEMLQIRVLEEIRPEQRFDSLEDLKKQIRQDETTTRNYFRAISE